MSEPIAIRLREVSKVYKLHGSQADQLIDVLGLSRFGFKTRGAAREFSALSDVSLDVPRGHRIGIIGRNGAGKTTLLKLICGNFAPTRGEVEVDGTVQALMNMGLGFHPEYTGRENVEASLQYNGLPRALYREAMAGIVEFCELGEFLDQPFKTYSLGMQARLMFATATAIRPDILIIDEVLGAGDAYFVAKSKQRVERMVGSGCTMLLVSHSMQQVLELCNEALWLDQGRIRMHGDALLVVKAYEEFMHGPIATLNPTVSPVGDEVSPVAAREATGVAGRRGRASASRARLQDPDFRPHHESVDLPEVASPVEFACVAPGGVSRWDSEPGVKVLGFCAVNERGVADTLISLRPASFVLTIIAEQTGSFRCRYGFVLNDHLGAAVTRIYSPVDVFSLQCGATRRVEMVLNPCQIGPGEYVVGISVLEESPLETLNAARRYDLLSRSFRIRVELPQSLGVMSAAFMHSAEWTFGESPTQ
jgi:lipopolysaccharide transport system ATP-binding protein